MKNRTTSFSGRSIVRAGERLATLYLSVPVHTGHTSSSEAVRLVYASVLLAGAGKLGREAFMDELNRLGSTITAGTGDDTVHFSLRALDVALVRTLELFRLALTSPSMHAKEIDRVKRNIVNELTLAKEDARARSYDAFVAALVSKNDRRYPYSLDTLIKEVRTVTRPDLVRFHKELFRHPWVYTVGGSTKSVKLIEDLLRRLSQRGKTTGAVVLNPKLRQPMKRSLILTDIPHKQNIEFSIGSKLPLLPTEREYAAFTLGMSILAVQGGFSGRLMSIVREKEGLTYMIYGKTERASAREYGFWRIMTFFNPKDAGKGITSTLREVKRMHDEGVTEDELRRFKQVLRTRVLLRDDSFLRQIAERHARSEMGITDEDYKRFLESIETMTQKEVNDVMQKYLNPEKLVISGAGPVRGVKKELREILSR